MNPKRKILQFLYSLNTQKEFCRLPKFYELKNRPNLIILEYEFVFVNQETETIPVTRFLIFDLMGNICHTEPPLTYNEINSLVPYDL